MNEYKLRQYIRRLISEEKDDKSEKEPDAEKKPEKKAPASETKPGEIGSSVGRGRWSKDVQEAGALAKENPEQLMKNLSIKKKGSGFQGVADILKQALVGSDVMSRAYASGLSSQRQGDMVGIVVKTAALDSRNGAKYIHHTLIGAKNAGMLSLDIPIQVDRLDDSSVVIYKSSKKNAWPTNQDTTD
jgi:hypothetical protein